MQRASGWLSKHLRSSDAWLLIVAGANWIHLRYLAFFGVYCSGGVASPWYCDWTWYSCANRLLIAALCVRSRHAWLEILGFLMAAHVLAGQLFYVVNTDEFSRISLEIKDAGIIEAVLHHTFVQGGIAAAIAIYALQRSVRRLRDGHWYRLVTTACKVGVIFILIGYASNFVSHRRAERATASWVYQDLLKSSAFYGKLSDQDYLNESAERFNKAGANVLLFKTSQYPHALPFGEVGPSYFTGPFFISVQYEHANTEGHWSGTCLVLNCFGYVRILDTDSSLWRRLIPYIWPY